MSDPRDYKLDLSTIDSSGRYAQSEAARPFIGVHFACCGVYRRVYREATDAEYVARCPLCARQMTFRVGPDGTNARTFVVK